MAHKVPIYINYFQLSEIYSNKNILYHIIYIISLFHLFLSFYFYFIGFYILSICFGYIQFC